MTIDPVGPDRVPAGGAQRPAEPESAESQQREGAASSVERGDRVEISEEGRALAGGRDIFESDPLRVQLIRSRLQDGAYHTPEVAERIALRLLLEPA